MMDVKLTRDELHERLGGGLPRGSLVLIEGEGGAGKSVLSQRLLYGALQNGSSAAVVSTELTSMGFVAQLASLGYPVSDALLAGRLAFLPVTPLFGRVRDAPRRLERLLRAGPVWERDLVVVDTASALLGRDVRDEPDRARRLAEDAATGFARRAARGTVVLLTADPCEAPADALAPLRAAASALLQATLTTKGGVSRSVLLRRYARAAETAGDAFSFRVEPGEGLVVEIRSVS